MPFSRAPWDDSARYHESAATPCCSCGTTGAIRCDEMKKRKRVPSRAGVGTRGKTIPAQEDATGADTADKYKDLRLPHERDENVGSSAHRRQPQIEQAQKDLAEGEVDTDRYGEASINFERQERKGGR